MRTDFGGMSGHTVGIVMRELARRAAIAIRERCDNFEAQQKLGYGGTMDDVKTDADDAAQAIYLKGFEENFPDFGVIGEENNLHIESKNGAFFTVDPLDGTKAFIRGQSEGVSTMIALVDDGEVIAAYVVDVNTLETYGYRPGSSKVHRIRATGSPTTLSARPWSTAKSHEVYGLLRDPPEKYGPLARLTAMSFRNYQVIGSSIGTWAARLWKGEVGALMLPAGFETPWDSTPVIGISEKLGYSFYCPSTDGTQWRQSVSMIPTEVVRRDYDLLIARPAFFGN